MRRVAGAIALLVGVALIVSLFALSLFTRADQGKEVLDGARPVLVGGGLKAMRRDLRHGTPAIGELTALIPEFAAHGKDNITIRHLLTHTAPLRLADTGWPHAAWDGVPGSNRCRAHTRNFAQEWIKLF